MAILDFISQVHLPSSVNMLPRYIKHYSCFWSIFIVTGVGCLEILITFVFSTFRTYYMAIKIYNSLPTQIKETAYDPKQFRKNLKSFLYLNLFIHYRNILIMINKPGFFFL
jgi:hypothetical protein